MQLWVGLGNPGAKYSANRHNIGFLAIDRIAADQGFGPWRKKFNAKVSEGQLGSEKVILLKPETFMNLSGQAVGEAMRFYKLEPGDVVVFHDELDLPPGRVKLKEGGGHAGHNGLRSISQHIGTDFARVRMGIGHPGEKNLVSRYVLSDFDKDDQQWLSNVMLGICDGAIALAACENNKFHNAVANRVTPPRTSGAKGNKEEKPAEPAPEPPKDDRSAMQKLLDKFR